MVSLSVYTTSIEMVTNSLPYLKRVPKAECCQKNSVLLVVEREKVHLFFKTATIFEGNLKCRFKMVVFVNCASSARLDHYEFDLT